MRPPSPVAIADRRQLGAEATPVTKDEVDRALARIAGAIPADLVVLFSLHLEAMAKEKAHGGLDVDLNMREGVVKSADFRRRSHWQSSR